MKSNAIGFPAEIEGVEILVGYEYEETHVPAEEENGYNAHDLIYIDITSVEIVTKGRGIDIYPFLTPKEVKVYTDAVLLNHNDCINA